MSLDRQKRNVNVEAETIAYAKRTLAQVVVVKAFDTTESLIVGPYSVVSSGYGSTLTGGYDSTLTGGYKANQPFHFKPALIVGVYILYCQNRL